MSILSAIIPAAGLGKRMNRAIPKALLTLDKKPIFIHTLEIISKHPQIEEVILVAPPSYIGIFQKKIKDYRIKKIKAVIPGGLTRQASVRNGLSYLDEKSSWVLIHDAVRPFINFQMISEVISEAKKYGAAILGVPINSTLKKIGKEMLIKETVPRTSIWESQTPQVFKKEIIIKAHRRFKERIFTDDAGMVEALGIKVKIVRGSFFNIKITEPQDLIMAEAILRDKKRYGL
jgi:2-C-methyl-D-erythritol 4-phosphate cytidylyltransferase